MIENLNLNSFSKIVIIGTSGSGKTTLAKALGEKFEIPDIELDSFFWDPNWTEASPETFRSRVQSATTNKGWVVHGNYAKVRDLIWHKADVILWLDYPRHIVFWRILKRSFQRAYNKTPVCNGNVESFQLSFFSKHSVILWSLKSFGPNRKSYAALMKNSPFGAKMRRFRKPEDAAELLK